MFGNWIRRRERKARVQHKPLLVEALEPRMLLSGVVSFTDAAGDGDRFRLVLTGPGHVAVGDVNQDGQAEITLNGTSPSSGLLIGLLRKSGDGRLSVEQINVPSGRLSGIYGFTTVDLAGPISPLTGNMNAIALHSIETGGTLSVAGDLRALAVQTDVALEAFDGIEVGRDLVSLFVGGNLNVGGGHITVGRDLRVATVIGDVNLFATMSQQPGENGFAATADDDESFPAFLGDISVGRDLRVATIVGDLNMGRSRLHVGRDLALLQVLGDLDCSGGGFIEVTRHLSNLQVAGDWTGPILLSPFLRSVNLIVGQAADLIHVGGMLDGAGLMMQQQPQEGPGPGPESLARAAVAANSNAVATLGRLEVIRGLSQAYVGADVIHNMVIGNGPGTAIARSAIVVTRRIDEAVILGDIVDSQILASPVVIEDFGDGPMALSQTNLLVKRLIAVAVRVGNRIETGVLQQAAFVTQITDQIPLSASIGTSRTPFLLLGDLVDSALAANAPLPDVSPAPPHPLAQATAALPSPNQAAIGTIFFQLGSGFKALETPDGNHPTGLFARRIHSRPANTQVIPRT